MAGASIFYIRYPRRKRKVTPSVLIEVVKNPTKSKSAPLQFPISPSPRNAAIIPHSRQNPPPAKRIRDWTTSGMKPPTCSFYLQTSQVPMHHKILCLALNERFPSCITRSAIASCLDFLALGQRHQLCWPFSLTNLDWGSEVKDFIVGNLHCFRSLSTSETRQYFRSDIISRSRKRPHHLSRPYTQI